MLDLHTFAEQTAARLPGNWRVTRKDGDPHASHGAHAVLRCDDGREFTLLRSHSTLILESLALPLLVTSELEPVAPEDLTATLDRFLDAYTRRWNRHRAAHARAREIADLFGVGLDPASRTVEVRETGGIHSCAISPALYESDFVTMRLIVTRELADALNAVLATHIAASDPLAGLDDRGTDELHHDMTQVIRALPETHPVRRIWDRLDDILTAGGAECLPAPWDTYDAYQD